MDNFVEDSMHEIQTALHNIVQLKWYYQIADLKSINVIDCKIPAMELVFKDDGSEQQQLQTPDLANQTPNINSGALGGGLMNEGHKNGNPVLSLIADYNSQLILHKLLEMKRGADRLKNERKERHGE